MGRVNMAFRNGTSTVMTVLRQCTQVDLSIYNTRATLVKNAGSYQKIVFNLTLFIKTATRKTKRRIIC
jgi:hypothetical protein